MGRDVMMGVVMAGLHLTAAVAVAQGGDSVWVNTRSRVYHCPGTQHYGRTSRGEYLPEPVARERGYRPNGGRACSPAGAPGLDSASTRVPQPLRGSGGSVDRGPAAPAGPTERCTVARIIDGDTIACVEQGSVRAIGVDTPESRQRPFADQATRALSAMIPPGAIIALEGDVSPRDRFRRTLAYLWYQGEMVNWRMVRDGWAIARRYPPDVRWAESLDSAESRARREGRGLWGSREFRCLPMVRRGGPC